MNLARTLYRWMVPGALAALAACGSDTNALTGAPTPPPATPGGGWLTLQLATPRSDDGAVQFTVSGPAIDSVKLVAYDGFATINAGIADLVVTGQIGNGDVARIHVPDLSLTAQYHATVAAAAARGTYALQRLDGYRAVLVR